MQETDVVFVINKREHSVCPKCASQIFIQQARKYAKGGSIYNKPKTVLKPTKDWSEEVRTVLQYLYNRLLGNKKDYKKSIPKAHLELIGKRLEEGYTVNQMLSVAYHKWKQWKDNPEMKQYITADTLFRFKNFPRYLAEVPEDINPENNKEQRTLLRELNHYIVSGERNETTKELVEKLKATGYDKQNILSQFE